MARAQCGVPGGPGGPNTNWNIQTRKPYPPTTPIATNGQTPNANTKKIRSSDRLPGTPVLRRTAGSVPLGVAVTVTPREGRYQASAPRYHGGKGGGPQHAKTQGGAQTFSSIIDAKQRQGLKIPSSVRREAGTGRRSACRKQRRNGRWCGRSTAGKNSWTP